MRVQGLRDVVSDQHGYGLWPPSTPSPITPNPKRATKRGHTRWPGLSLDPDPREDLKSRSPNLGP